MPSSRAGIQVTIRLPSEVIAALDRDIAARREYAPGIRVHRSDIVRDMVLRAVRSWGSVTDDAAVPYTAR